MSIVKINRKSYNTKTEISAILEKLCESVNDLQQSVQRLEYKFDTNTNIDSLQIQVDELESSLKKVSGEVYY